MIRIGAKWCQPDLNSDPQYGALWSPIHKNIHFWHKVQKYMAHYHKKTAARPWPQKKSGVKGPKMWRVESGTCPALSLPTSINYWFFCTSSLHLPGTATSTLHTDTLDFIPSHVYKTPVDQHTVAYVNLGEGLILKKKNIRTFKLSVSHCFINKDNNNKELKKY